MKKIISILFGCILCSLSCAKADGQGVTQDHLSSGIFVQAGVGSMLSTKKEVSDVEIQTNPAPFQEVAVGEIYSINNLSIRSIHKNRYASVAGDMAIGYVHHFPHWFLSGNIGYGAGGPKTSEIGATSFDWNVKNAAGVLVEAGNTKKDSSFSLSRKIDQRLSVMLKAGISLNKWLPYVQVGCSFQHYVVSMRNASEIISTMDVAHDFYTTLENSDKVNYWAPALVVGAGLDYAIAPKTFLGLDFQLFLEKSKKFTTAKQFKAYDIDGGEVGDMQNIKYNITKPRSVHIKTMITFSYLFSIR
jgi:opacity protein-like surface antigen